MGLIGGISPGGSIALGIIVGLLSTSVQSLGLTLQRKSHILEDEKVPYDVRRPPYRRRRWQLGMGMFIISNVVGSSVQISMLPLPVLSTLQASGLVFNSICATLILGEPFTRWSLWGTLLVCGGAVLIAIFGAIPSPAHKLSELLDLLGRRPFVLWMSFQAVFVIGLAVATECVSRFTTLMQDPRFRLARGFSYGCISGTLSAHSLLVAKSAVELIVRTIADGDNQFVHWQSWMLVVTLVTLALTQLYYLHRGLKLVSTSVLYPLIFCIYNIIAILDGLIYFRQTDLINPLRACLITLGTVILLSGVLALSWRLSDEQHTPGVGQSTLAPGLGLIDDTDGEEEEEELSLRSALLDEPEGALPAQSSYQTFGSASSPEVSMAPATPLGRRQSSMARSTRAASSRWAEQAEIWDELEDRNTPEPASPAFSRRRSTTLPAHRQTSSSMFARRGTTDSRHLASTSEAPEEAEPLMESPRRMFRKRRKSTGFPGFTARKTTGRKTSGGIQDAAHNIWGFRWWGKRPGPGPTGPTDSPRSSSASWAVPAYRDDLEAGLASPSSESRPPPGPALRPGPGSGSRNTRQDDSPV
ncbi:magnesium transporter NIPA-domain-containing protein [Chaetomidium leptoderma]|uniref:Magnesium transporter NIPA-domain-containing protein n=1 Tax=Chaetomidium leptoderma TaxID=669021 RepID=A0AAN6VNG3_9PEZI|nr:magnesium transporter NIPA-domain-containing protein [Chaetomidium leptoderma]